MERFDPETLYRNLRMPDGAQIVLCEHCVLEEFMVPGGWGYRFNLPGRLPLNALQPIPRLASTNLGYDKFCSRCNLRYKFLKIVATRSEA